MNLAREEAIRNFREHWASLAITGVDKGHKRDYLRRHGFPPILFDCFLCEFTKQICDRCPIEWPKTHKNSPEHSPCFHSYYGDWANAADPEERKRLAAIIRDLPEKSIKKKAEAPKSPPKYKHGDKVVPVSKSAGFAALNSVKETMQRENKDYLIVKRTLRFFKNRNDTLEAGTPSLCWLFLESDLIPYIEPKKFKVGDRIIYIGQETPALKGKCGTISFIDDSTTPYAVNFDEDIRGENRFWVKRENIQLASAPLNLCPTPHSEKYIFNGPATVCIIEQNGKQYKGVVKCYYKDVWDEEIGRKEARKKALEQMN